MRGQQAVTARKALAAKPSRTACVRGVLAVNKQQRQRANADQVTAKAHMQAAAQPVPYCCVLRLLEQQHCCCALRNACVSECECEAVVGHTYAGAAGAACCC